VSSAHLRSLLLLNTNLDRAKPILSYLIASLCSSKHFLERICEAETDTVLPDSATNYPITNAGVQPSLSQATGLSIYRILAQILDDPLHMTKLVAALPLHRILIVILSSNPLTEAVSTTFAIYRSAITHSPDDQFEKKFSAEVSWITTPGAF
jgi:hypothetical protein